MTSMASIVLSNLLIACLLAMIATVVGWSGRRAALAHLLWMAVFLKFVTPPIVQAPVDLPDRWLGQMKIAQEFFDSTFGGRVEAFDVQDQSVSQRTAGTGSLTNPQSSSAVADHAIASALGDPAQWPALSLGSCLIAIWILGASTLIVRGVYRFVRFSYLLRREGVLDAEASLVVRQLLRRDEETFSPSVCRIRARISPMLFGVGRATWIVCPDSLWTSLGEEQRRAFLAHEVAHYQRRDHWVRWLEWLVTALYWWMPLIYLARIQLERHEEAACDAWALGRLGTSPRSYAETLLSVIDFLSESRTGAPRLASRMQATGSLEERLRLIMQWQQPRNTATKQYVALGACCVALLVVHPTVFDSRARSSETVVSSTELSIAGREQEHNLRTDHDEKTASRLPLVDLPPAPVGWWNATPSRTWADKVLGESELRLLARVGIGIGVSQPGGQAFTFDPKHVRALAYVVPSGRLVVGTSTGQLHLWDTQAHQSVSLIGKHNAGITSIAFHPSGGLISGDETGTVISWDISSGQMLATRSFDGPIGSVRWSNDGSELGVMVGDWTSNQPNHRLELIDPEQLQTSQSVALPPTIAVVAHDERLGWLAIDWSGAVWSLTEGNMVDALEKQLVSGAVMCQDLFPITAEFGTDKSTKLHTE